jgi:hypothetical protein
LNLSSSGAELQRSKKHVSRTIQRNSFDVLIRD